MRTLVKRIALAGAALALAACASGNARTAATMLPRPVDTIFRKPRRLLRFSLPMSVSTVAEAVERLRLPRCPRGVRRRR